jgi:5-carboxymethyl-2-hydroxymuconate isomerase
LNRNELEDFCWIPFEELVQSKALVKFDSGEFPACSVRNRVIWGLTYKILENLFTVYRQLNE